VAAIALPVVVVPASPAAALAPVQFRVPGFSFTRSDTGLPGQLMDFVYLPNGRIMAIGKSGAIRQGNFGDADEAWVPVSVSLPNLNSEVDRGLTGISLAPDFATSRQVYLLYDYAGTNCAIPGPGEPNGNVCGRLSRFTANDANNPTALTNEVPLVSGVPAFSATGAPNDKSHTVGTVIAAPDGTVFFGTGEASSTSQAENTSFFSAQWTSPRGKIFRVNGTDGGPAPGNPHSGGYWESRIFAVGMRNPFRFSLKPNTGTGAVPPVLYIGDVGSAAFEEINVAHGGENFGWPCYEGPLDYRNEFSASPTCQAEYAQGTAGITAPLWYYPHQQPGPGNAIIAGTFYEGSNYGPLNGSFFLADNPFGVMWTLKTNANDQLVSAPSGRDDWFAGPQNNGYPPDGGLGLPVAIHTAPDGNIQYGELDQSDIYELQGCGSQCPPVATATVTPQGGAPGTVFHFDASQSYAPSGGGLSYSWDFGDGQVGSGVAVDHSSAGLPRQNWTATLTVTASNGQSTSTTVKWSTLHAPPGIGLTPNKQGKYAVGEPVTMTADVTGYNTADQPYSIGGNDVRWDVVIHHCPSGVNNGCHIHPSTPTPQPTGNTFSMAVPDHGDLSYLEFRVTGTDADGLSSTASFNVPMDNHTIFLSSNQPAVQLTINAHVSVIPTSETAATGSSNLLIAPPSANGVPFSQWSDGDTNLTKQFVMPASDVALAACYGGPCAAFRATPPGLFTSVTPYRLFDTRDPALNPFGSGTPLTPGQTLAVNLGSQPGPPDRKGVLLNVTTDQPAAAGYVRAFPCGQEPNTSTVNFDPGQTAANLAMVLIPDDGQVCFTSFVPTHLIVDVAGWFAPDSGGVGDGYVGVEPVRLFDTRQSTPLAAGQEMRFSLAGHSGFPGNASAALLNLTVTEPQGPGYVKVYPCGQENTTSNVNYVAGQTVANLAAVKVAPGGDVCFRSFATTHLVVDLAGWYAPGATGTFTATEPIRLFDTRQAAVLSRFAAGQEVAYQVAGTVLVPPGATAIAFNVTATHPGAAGYVKVYPCGANDPLVSDVNYRANQEAAANLAVVKLPADGRVCFRSFAATDLVVDLAGWYTG
jgi:glucose/arabinose dehydrogenase